VDRDTTQFLVGSDGKMEAYEDSFRLVSQEDVEKALELENNILVVAGQISTAYLQIAKALAEFKDKKYYKARGFETFNLWAESDNLKSIGKRTAHDLIRIYNEALPIFAKHDAMDALPMINSSTMRALLPILSDENGEDKFIEAAYAVKDLTVRDSYATIDEIRGKPNRYEEDDLPTVFSAAVKRGPNYHTVEIVCLDPEQTYTVGKLTIHRSHWPAWEKRFGRFVEIVE
jgi:hypothetical protein